MNNNNNKKNNKHRKYKYNRNKLIQDRKFNKYKNKLSRKSNIQIK